MASRTVKHGKHEHVIKTVNEEVSGLLIDDRGTNKISEAFGWNEDKLAKCFTSYLNFSDYQDAIDKLDDDLPKSTKVSTFVDFIKSPYFKSLNIKLESPNDYLMMGFVFGTGIVKKNLFDDVINLVNPSGIDQEKLKVLIEKVKSIIEER